MRTIICYQSTLPLSNICRKQIKFAHIFYSKGQNNDATALTAFPLPHTNPASVKPEGNGLKMKLLTYRYQLHESFLLSVSLFLPFFPFPPPPALSITRERPRRREKCHTSGPGNVLRHRIPINHSPLTRTFVSLFSTCGGFQDALARLSKWG